jgi:integrase
MTLNNYRIYSKVVYQEIGHKKLEDIRQGHIEKFVKALREGGRYREYGLSAKSIKNYVSFISGVFQYAKEKQVINFNPCENVRLPKADTEEKEIYSIEEMKNILALLHQEDEKNFQFTVYFTLAVFTGFRRGEMLGLEFSDIDFDKQIITVRRTSNYTKSKGIYTDKPKTKTSQRTLKLPQQIIDLLKQYQAHQAAHVEKMGNKWTEQIKGLNDKMVINDRLFTNDEGKPMFITTPSKFFKRFCKKHGINFLPIHSIRHFNASAMINAGVDVKAVQHSLGHSLASTTMNIYCHVFQAANAAAMDSIVSVIGLPTMTA